MPELPEVEVTRRGIAPALVGRRLTSADFRAPALRYPLPHAQRAAFVDQRLISLTRRAKYRPSVNPFGHVGQPALIANQYTLTKA